MPIIRLLFVFMLTTWVVLGSGKANADTPNGSEGVDSTVAVAKAGGLVVTSGAETPYQTIRYTHFVPIVVHGATLLWAWPTNERKLPTAILYKPEPSGTLTKVCQFQRVLENF